MIPVRPGRRPTPLARAGRGLRWSAAAALAAVLLAAVVPAADAPAADHPVPAAAEYAYGFPVITEETADLYRLELPPAFYRSTYDPDLRDSGVYNAAGSPVPRVFEPPPAAERLRGPRRAVPFYGLSRAESQATDRLRLLLESEGASLQLDAPGRPLPAGGDLAAYIVDVRALTGAVVALHLEWPRLDGNFLGRVEVDGSDDLAAWQPLGGATVADLRQEDGRIEQGAVDLRPTRARYLRLRWSDLPEPWSLSSVEAEAASGLAPEQRSWAEVSRDEAEAPRGEEAGWTFDLGASPPADRFALELPDDNTVVRARISAWDPARSRWDAIHEGLFYHLRQGGNALASDPVAFPARRTRRFKVEMLRGRVDGEWGVRIGWRPDALVFVAQGEGPYRVVAGRALDALEGFPQARVLGDRGILDLVDDERYGDATLGARFELAGAGSLTLREPVRWRMGALWAVLILGVLFVGGMAWRLLKETPGDD